MMKITFLDIAIIMASTFLSFNAVAQNKPNTISFYGMLAEPSCYSDLSTVSCYDTDSNELTVQEILPVIVFNIMFIGQIYAVPTEFKQVNSIDFTRTHETEIILSLNYN
ncbi:hypothetical protein [Shewanella baltica]|uniref:hypothetical protein n=1 Tax=Shewanella baltica TaxID=62322 RepID=UPI0001883F92|nr:hypothetical protein [Shewanella baltica]ACK48561.1 hypothetical protein Sbal223_4089 [Shewanella baltica OS223]